MLPNNTEALRAFALTYPTVNLNGTYSKDLTYELDQVIHAANEMEKALRGLTIHLRDYHMQPNGIDQWQADIMRVSSHLKTVALIRESALAATILIEGF
jgi:hypothetical protein